MPNEKVHKSIRIDRDVDQAVAAMRQEGESEAAAYARVLRAGLEAIQGAEKPQEGAQAAGDGMSGSHDQDGRQGPSEAVLDVLREQLDVMRGQLEEKDRQIARITELADQAQVVAKQSQQLHLLAETGKAGPQDIEDSQADTQNDEPQGRRGWWSRHFGRK